MLTSCPSAPADAPNAVVIGVASENGRVAMLRRPVPLQTLAHLIPPELPASEVLRLSAPCAEHACRHFAASRCQLASRIVARLPALADRLAPCAIRPSCRWWQQEGPAACHRCPQVVTEPHQTDDLMREVAGAGVPTLQL